MKPEVTVNEDTRGNTWIAFTRAVVMVILAKQATVPVCLFLTQQET